MVLDELVLNTRFALHTTNVCVRGGWLKEFLSERHGEDGFLRIRDYSLEDFVAGRIGEQRVGKVRNWVRKKLKGRNYKTHLGRYLGMSLYEKLEDLSKSRPYRAGVDATTRNSFGLLVMIPFELGYVGMSFNQMLATRATMVPGNAAEGVLYGPLKEYLFLRFGIEEHGPTIKELAKDLWSEIKTEKRLSLKDAKYFLTHNATKKFLLENACNLAVGLPVYMAAMGVSQLVSGENFDSNQFEDGFKGVTALCLLVARPMRWYFDRSYELTGIPKPYVDRKVE